MTKRIFTFVAPDGSKLKRTSVSRTYTHAILYKLPSGKWKLGSCIGRQDLVAERLEYWGKGSLDCVAVPAEPNGGNQ